MRSALLSTLTIAILAPVSAPAAAGSPTPAVAKVSPEVAREMADAIVAVDKALGLESWAAHGDKPCIDRGGLGARPRTSAPKRRASAPRRHRQRGFPRWASRTCCAILMADIGPVTVLALGTGDAAGWGAYSCDPGASARPIKIGRPARNGANASLDRQRQSLRAADDHLVPRRPARLRRRGDRAARRASRLCRGAKKPRPAVPPAHRGPPAVRRVASEPTRRTPARCGRGASRARLRPTRAGARTAARVRNTRSGCGIMIVTRPSAVVRAVMPPGEPLGFAG